MLLVPIFFCCRSPLSAMHGAQLRESVYVQDHNRDGWALCYHISTRTSPPFWTSPRTGQSRETFLIALLMNRLQYT
jgi:hypothetical protein